MPVALVIYNPKSGSRFHRTHPSRIKQALNECGIKYTWTTADSYEKIRAHAKNAVNEGYKTVIACGGDGTVRAIASTIEGSASALGILPIGTANLFARDIGIPMSLLSAARLICSDYVRPVDVGFLGDRPFILMCGVGVDARAIRNVIPRMKHWIGWGSYLYSGVLNFFRHKVFQAKVYLDSRDRAPMIVRTPLIIVGNARAYGLETFRVTHLAELDDGLLDVCIFSAQSMYELMRNVISVVLRRHLHDEHVLYFKTKRLWLETVPRVPVQLDGDWVSETPLEISVKHSSLRLHVPQDW